jgi:2-oxoacid:acceptor oxidoreductase delta subunit (pyruvate/2-ketoisovalerate family)
MKTLKTRRILGPVATEFTAMNTGSWRIEKPSVNQDLCIGCGTCERNCPANVITINKEPKMSVIIDMRYCKGCGICSDLCPRACIQMIPEQGGENES